jgi:DNA-binding transcriptional regulator LsrR (DeoR family)
MNQTDLQIYEMYFVDGMKESEIAESMGLSLLTVHEVLAVLEEMLSDKEEV